MAPSARYLAYDHSVPAAAKQRERDSVPAAADALASLESQAHARAVLGPVLSGAARPSHAYLFHGPPGTGKRRVARAFAAALLAEDAEDPDAVSARVMRGSHPDLTWVTPSGATEMLVSDIDEPVVAAATRTPFEAARRVFVIESAHMLNDQAANRMLKTLEEPAEFVHLLLLSNRPEELLPTIASRCQHVRFDPLPAARIAENLSASDPDAVLAASRLALGDAGRAALLTGARGTALRESAEAFVRASLVGDTRERPWLRLLELARAAGTQAGEQAAEQTEGELELIPLKERKRFEREAGEARRRIERRARIAALDLTLGLAELWVRDLLCVSEGAPELIYAADRRAQLEHEAGGFSRPARLRDAVQLVADTRLRLTLNVSEELALEALSYRLQELMQ
ncbi:MAG TPA: AAA family ATPase [Solirubrobacteraceae bacterium]|nr:AAA family ATPase [Solirubrobacteraceae bacterium]